ncbi:hypothetical protein HMPREF0758_3433 [Serratia odorifera DSM 4582]|uniref:Uncharacterized protein n=1 Tax=Serratia odorifera DSM 4582 TaxID=667129 RepID=D4E5I3_SEROD|nr:hypothetical protein HMPREF0758_3433 [Serratia odorifera DSM 4582]
MHAPTLNLAVRLIIIADDEFAINRGEAPKKNIGLTSNSGR